MSLLRVQDLNVWFGIGGGRELHAVQDVGFEVGRGEVFGLVGESGCGKTTTVLSIMGLLPSSASVSGEVMLDSVNVISRGEASVRPHRWTDVAMIFQGSMNAFSPVKTIGWQIAEPMEVHGIASGKQARQRVAELLEMVGISPAAADRYPHQFSGGMRQRAAIAMALACDPKLLLADEPTTALDVMIQAQILRLLTDLAEQLSLTVILVTHDLPVVAQVCDRSAVMYAGEIVEVASVEELFHDPRHPYTRLLFAATPDVSDEEEMTSIPGSPPRLDHEITGCPFRPRCDVPVDRCERDRPRLLAVGPGRSAACHRNGPATGGTEPDENGPSGLSGTRAGTGSGGRDEHR